MKRILIGLFLLLIFSSLGFSQTLPVISEQCTLDATITSCALINETGAGFGAHVESWTINGTNTGSTILLQYSDTSQTAGFSTLITGTSTSSGESSVTAGTHRFWRFTLSGFTATSVGASVVAVHKAYNFTPGTASIGSVTIDQSTPGTTNGIVCNSGCGGGTTDTDDGSIAAAQTGAIGLSLTQFYDGTVWRRATSGSGTVGTGTLRVVIATDQTQLTNKLLVTPDSVALPANQSVNVSQINGATPLMGAGNTGTGSPRVTIATDQAKVPIAYSDGTSLLSTDVAPVGGNASTGTVQFENCDTPFKYDTNTNGSTELIALSSSKIIRVCGLSMVNSTTSAVTVSFRYGTGTACATGATTITPAWVLPAQTSAIVQGLVLPNSVIPYFKTIASNALCIFTSAGVSIQVLGTASQR